MSDDGQCVIEIISPKPSDSDVASRLDISRAAEQVMEKCLDDPASPATGGWIKNIGMSDFGPRTISFFVIKQTVRRPLTPSNLTTGSEGKLAVVVRKYTPNVACGNKFPASGHPRPCQVTLSRLPTSSIPMIFGRRGSPGMQWSVPWEYTASMCNCHLHSHASVGQDLLTVRLTPKQPAPSAKPR